jgi:hypothetical protein
MESPFGAYRGGYQVLPQGWMEVATEPGRNYAKGMQALGSSVITAAGSLAKGMEDKAINKESAPTMLSQYQQVAEATGQQVDPTILERYQNIGQMSGPQIQQFNQDVSAAQQRAIELATMQRQQQMLQIALANAQRGQSDYDLTKLRAGVGAAIGALPLPKSNGNYSPIPQSTVPALPANPSEPVGYYPSGVLPLPR